MATSVERPYPVIRSSPMPDSVQREATVAAAVPAMVACVLGDPIAYLAEKSGALVQDVVPVRGKETFSGNAGSVLLTFRRVTVHGRTAFHPRYDGADRWLRRTFAVTDLRRSRDHRPHDGYLLTR
ncbi:hypothetical protein [Nocardia terrae]|uniref:hypothetical protein n=1 Tax=Nocardia terrae TaxID=2675851 RepID=UPI0018DF4227|nr:hypothetical protein [Nocardia terrae]